MSSILVDHAGSTFYMKSVVGVIFTDLDGVLTDGNVEYTSENSYYRARRYSVLDGAAMSEIVTAHKILPIILTASVSNDIIHRARHLNIPVFLGCEDKLEEAIFLVTNYCKDTSIDNCAFIGDDLADIELLKAVGYAGTPSTGTRQVKRVITERMRDGRGYMTLARGGSGAFREFAFNAIAKFFEPPTYTKEIALRWGI